jgi:predicted nucleotidyltransferase component of viral defense system
MIPQRALSLIANSHQKTGGLRIPEAVIERDYCLAWFLTGLAGHPLREALAFKGGTALRRCWFADYRFSEDLDFTLTQALPFEVIRSGLDAIFAGIEAASGIRMAFDREDRHGHQNTHTFYLRYQGPLPAENDVKVDITINETLGFPLVDRQVIRTYDAFADLPDGPTIRAYALEEIMVEKLVALTDRARTEPRDLFDLAHLLDHTGAHFVDFRIEVEAKLGVRGRSLAGLEKALAAKQSRLAKLWAPRLGHQMSALPPFDAVFRNVQRTLRDAAFGEPSQKRRSHMKR